MLIPVVFILGTAFNIDFIIWQKLFTKRIIPLLINSIFLVTSVSTGALVLGGGLALLVERSDLPFKKLWRFLLIMPLMIPCYILAICYINFMGKNGLAERILMVMGVDWHMPNLYGFWGATITLILGVFPYVFLLSSSSLRSLDQGLYDSAKCLGITRMQRFFKITIPLLLPALTASCILVSLYVLSDFGVVNLLHFPTFVSVIYDQISTHYNFQNASVLSGVLLMVMISLFILQDRLVREKQYCSTRSSKKYLSQYHLGYLKFFAIIFILGITLLSFIIPLGILMYWFIQSLGNVEIDFWRTSFYEIVRSGINSIYLSVLVSTVAVVLAVVLSYYFSNNRKGRCVKFLIGMAQSGVALPGVLIALGVSLILTLMLPNYVYSIFAMFLALLIHFFSQTYQTIFSGFCGISKKVEESARLLGYSSFKAFFYVTRPLLMPSLIMAWGLTFLSSMRELPASLLLRPAGFDTLTVKVWIAASEGFYEHSALPALFIIILSVPLVIFVSRRNDQYETT